MIAGLVSPRPASRTRAWGIVGALSVTETVSWGILYYAFAVFLLPMQRELGYSAAQLTGAFSLALLVSAVAGLAVGRHLDRRSPRAVMTLGSVAGVLLVLAWSQVEGLAAFYALWVGIGLVMAAVLYEPAFTVLAKWFPEPAARRRAMTTMTLAGALASFIFLPLAQVLIDDYGWRDALVVLALMLALVTVPLHAVSLRAAPEVGRSRHVAMASASARQALRSASFWLLSGAFFLATAAAIAVTAQGIPFLLERGYSPSFVAFSIGVIGVSQIPGRLLFAPVAERLPAPWGTVALFVLIAAGIALIVGIDATLAVVAGLVLLGMGNGMATLARATVIADRYGAAAYGTIASVAASATIGARARGTRRGRRLRGSRRLQRAAGHARCDRGVRRRACVCRRARRRRSRRMTRAALGDFRDDQSGAGSRPWWACVRPLLAGFRVQLSQAARSPGRRAARSTTAHSLAPSRPPDSSPLPIASGLPRLRPRVWYSELGIKPRALASRPLRVGVPAFSHRSRRYRG